MQAYLKLLEDLIQLRPVSKNAQAVNRATELLHGYLAGHGLHCTVEELDGRKILYASNVPGKNPDVLLNAHIDVVPAAYESQYEPEIRNGWLFARGSSDCLGNAVCIVKTLCEAEPDASIGAIFTADEEIGGETSKYMAEAGYCPKRILFVMDHWNQYNICCAQKGILVVRLTAGGKGGHSSAPWAFENPIDKLMDGYLRFRNIWKNPTAEDSWHASMAATVITGGMVGNQIPDTAEMLLNFRYVRPEEKDGILQKLRETTGLEVSIVETCPPVTVSTDAPELKLLQDAVEEIVGVRPGFDRMHGATDARWFTVSGRPIAICGVQGSGAHAKVEKVNLDSIGTFSRIIRKFCEKLNRK